MVSPTDILIEDFDNRCQEIFSDTGNRCWNLAVKNITFQGKRKSICLAHYEKWLEEMAGLSVKLNHKGG